MTLEEIRNYCLKLPGVTESIKWEEHLCFSVGDKMFLLTSPDQYPINASFKTTEEIFNRLTGRPGIKQAPYFARGSWLHIDDIERLATDEWIELIDTAYQLIYMKLPKSVRDKIR